MFEKKKQSESKISEQTQNLSKDYVRTTDQQKIELIDLVINQKYSMKLASQIVGVKLSTVKYIVKAYKTDKEYFMQKLRPKKANLQRESKNVEIQKQISLEPAILQKSLQQYQANPSDDNTLKASSEVSYYPSLNFFQNYALFQSLPQVIAQWNSSLIYSNSLFF